VRNAKTWISAAIAAAHRLGVGHGHVSRSGIISFTDFIEE
jgi:hypothetical protein